MIEPTLNSLDKEIELIKKGEADCQRDMERRMKALEEWKENLNRNLIAILFTSSISALTGIIIVILTWALKK